MRYHIIAVLGMAVSCWMSGSNSFVPFFSFSFREREGLYTCCYRLDSWGFVVQLGYCLKASCISFYLIAI